MGWLKRNLFFAMGGFLALGLLGAAIFYAVQSWRLNTADFGKLNEIYSSLNQMNNQQPSPGNGKVDNIAAAQAQEKQVEGWIHRAREYFQPIAPVPETTSGPVLSEAFANALHRTIDLLQHEAAAANVDLPPQFDFSFTAQNNKVLFAPGSLQPLAQQLGDVKAISEVMFAARVNALESIQRVAVSPDDTTGPSADYLSDDQPVTTSLAVLTPYQVTFRGFSTEIARVIEALASSPHEFIIKNISVQPASMSRTGNPNSAGVTAPIAPRPVNLPGLGGLQTVLNEQMLRVTILIEVVKLTPGN